MSCLTVHLWIVSHLRYVPSRVQIETLVPRLSYDICINPISKKTATFRDSWHNPLKSHTLVLIFWTCSTSSQFSGVWETCRWAWFGPYAAFLIQAADWGCRGFKSHTRSSLAPKQVLIWAWMKLAELADLKRHPLSIIFQRMYNYLMMGMGISWWCVGLNPELGLLQLHAAVNQCRQILWFPCGLARHLDSHCVPWWWYVIVSAQCLTRFLPQMGKLHAMCLHFRTCIQLKFSWFLFSNVFGAYSTIWHVPGLPVHSCINSNITCWVYVR